MPIGYGSLAPGFSFARVPFAAKPFNISRITMNDPQPVYVVAVPNHLVMAILSTLCCCLPTGIVAIVYAAQVNSKLAGGDHAGAVAASENAKKWSYITIGIGVVLTALYVVAGALGLVPSHR
jgi:hypothetical protein